jgi:hypothetical protein
MTECYPWGEAARLARHIPPTGGSTGVHEIVAAGSLSLMLAAVQRFSIPEREHLLIDMHERAAPPFRFGPADFSEMIQAKKRR